MSIWEVVTWNIARAGGLTAYALLTLAVVVGLALSLHWQSPRWPRLINSELHNFLTLLALVFTGVHVLAVWVDPFTHFGWSEVFVPLASHYRPVWMALGIVGLYLGIAIGLSTWLRPTIGYVWWRRLHVLTLALYALVTVHGIATGSDTHTWWAVGIYVASIAAVGFLLLFRLGVLGARPSGAQHASRPQAPRVPQAPPVRATTRPAARRPAPAPPPSERYQVQSGMEARAGETSGSSGAQLTPGQSR